MHNPLGPVHIVPLGFEFSVAVEHLDAMVFPVSDIGPSHPHRTEYCAV